ncbi:MAG: NAD(P)H-hydrate dehydratase [Dongiaceae bacterium]
MSEVPANKDAATEAVLSLRVVSAQEMRLAEQNAFKAGLASFTAMERAGRAVATAICARWETRPTVVLCGPGNNGGDGYIVAALLRQAGWPVTVTALAPPASPDAVRAAADWTDPVVAIEKVIWPGPEGLIVDALFGTGLGRDISGAAAALIASANSAGSPIVAVDIASGVDADSGAVLGSAIRASLTVTFAWRKFGQLVLPGRQLAGDIVVADIGLSAGDLSAGSAAGNAPAWLNDANLWRDKIPVPTASAHKYSRGHLLAVGGAVMTGAVRLATRSARRAGVGLATILAPADTVAIYAADQAGVIVRPRADAGAMAAICADRRISAILIGSGLEAGGETPSLLRTALAADRPTVIDGGGLDAWKDLHKQELADSAAPSRTAAIVLTPHEGEFSRLCGDIEARGGKVARARAAAREFQAVIVLKGADTVIAAPDGRAVINGDAPAYLATAGSGDVLAGLISGLLAQEMEPLAAATAAVWLHAEAARLFGPGLLAEDLPDLLPSAIAGILPS